MDYPPCRWRKIIEAIGISGNGEIELAELSSHGRSRTVSFPRFHPWPAHLFAALLVCISANCQQKDGTGSVRGSVHLADTKQPAEGTSVSLTPPADQEFPKIDEQSGEYVIDDKFGPRAYSAKVDASGSFQIDGVSPGDYFVLAYRSGYLSQREYIYPGALSPELNPGQSLPAFVQKVHVTSGKTEQVNLLLERGGVIEGTVSFPDVHMPVPHAQTPEGDRTGIAVNVEIKTKGGRLVRAMGAAHTDAAGRYRIDSLPPASYAVFVALPGGMVSTAKGLIGSGGEIIYCCNSVRGSKARIIEVHGMETHEGIDISIPTAGLHSVTGTAVTESGQPVRQGLARLYPTGEQELTRTTPVKVDGTFSFDQVPDEDYTVSLETERQTEVVGPTVDGKGIVMRIKKPVFLPAQQNIRVSGQNPPPVILKVQSVPN